MHAGWNLLARFEHSERDFYRKMLIVIMVIGLIPAVVSEYLTRSLTSTAWICVIGSGISAGVYLYFLARAYESSDFSIVYPVARALPVIFVAVGDVLRGRYLTPAGWVGVFLVAGGIIFVPLQSFRNISLKNYLNRTSLWMLLAALGTVGYTILDKIAAETVQQSPATAARYGYFYFAVSYLPYLMLLKAYKGKDEISEPTTWKLAIPAALLSFAAYWLSVVGLPARPLCRLHRRLPPDQHRDRRRDGVYYFQGKRRWRPPDGRVINRRRSDHDRRLGALGLEPRLSQLDNDIREDIGSFVAAVGGVAQMAVNLAQFQDLQDLVYVFGLLE